MNILLLLPEEKVENSFFKVVGRKASHIIQILKTKEKEKVRAGLMNSAKGQFQVLEINSKDLTVVGEFIPESEPEDSSLNKVILLTSYQRPQTVKKILHSAAVCGIGGIYFFPMDKSEKSYETSSLWKKGEYKEELYLGLEQGSRVNLPEIRTYSKKSDILQFKNKCILLLDPSGKELMFDVKEHVVKTDRIFFLLGPESGFSLREMDLFQGFSKSTVSLSESVLRSEQAFCLQFLRQN